MICNRYKYGRRLFFCLLFVLSINTKAAALDKKASSALSHYIMAVMYESLNQIDKSIEEYRKAVKLDYKNSVIHLNLASSYIKNKEPEKAINELKLTAELEPEAVEPHAILALLYSSQNKVQESNQEYEMALKNASKLQPENIDIYKSLAVVYLKQQKLKEAQDTYKLILDLSPSDAQAHFYLASIYEESKDRVRAEEELKKAIELKPDYQEALNYLGYLYVEENKNLNQAETMIRKASEIEPDNGAYIDSLGWLYFKQGKFQEAIKELGRASILLKDPVIFDHLGDVYFKIGDMEKAKISWQNSLDLDSKQGKAKEKIDKLNK